jgi:Flp pilus assembly protein TadG
MTLPRIIRRRRFRGQSLVEFALILPIFLLILFGLVDMGRAVYANSTLSQASREAARLVSVQASWVGSTDANCNTDGGPVCPADLNALRANALDAANRMMAPFGTIAATDFHLSCAATPPSGDWVSPPQACTARAPLNLASVRVEMDFEPITPIIGQLIGLITLSGSATMVIN